MKLSEAIKKSLINTFTFPVFIIFEYGEYSVSDRREGKVVGLVIGDGGNPACVIDSDYFPGLDEMLDIPIPIINHNTWAKKLYKKHKDY